MDSAARVFARCSPEERDLSHFIARSACAEPSVWSLEQFAKGGLKFRRSRPQVETRGNSSAQRVRCNYYGLTRSNRVRDFWERSARSRFVSE